VISLARLRRVADPGCKGTFWVWEHRQLAPKLFERSQPKCLCQALGCLRQAAGDYRLVRQPADAPQNKSALGRPQKDASQNHENLLTRLLK
jgi:hypothetical protein